MNFFHRHGVLPLAAPFFFLAGCATDNALAPTQRPVTATAATSAENSSGEVIEISKLDQKPVPRSQARPIYPAELRSKSITGEAVVEFVVDSHGNVRDATALRHTHPAFGEAAVASVIQWKFQPGRKGGRAVTTRLQVPIVFSLGERAAVVPAVPAGPLSGETFDISKLDQIPRARVQVPPIYPVEQRTKKITGEAVVDFIVDTQGDVRNAFVMRNTQPPFGEAAVEAVAQWKFQPGVKNGRVVNTHMQVPIVFTLNEK